MCSIPAFLNTMSLCSCNTYHTPGVHCPSPDILVMHTGKHFAENSKYISANIYRKGFLLVLVISVGVNRNPFENYNMKVLNVVCVNASLETHLPSLQTIGVCTKIKTTARIRVCLVHYSHIFMLNKEIIVFELRRIRFNTEFNTFPAHKLEKVWEKTT